MTTAQSIINQAARKITVLGRGQTMGPEETQDALTNLNTLVGSLSTDVGMIFNNIRELFPLTGQQSYTIGVGADFDTPKPVVINAAYIRIGTVDYPIKQLNSSDYADIGFKTISGIPEFFYYENNTPLARIFLYPVGVANYQLGIYSLKALDSFVDLTTDYDLPPGAEDMYVYNLAKRLAAEYEKPVPAEVHEMAHKTRNNVRAFNKRNSYPTSYIDIAGSTGNTTGNIYSGWYTR